MKRTSGIYGRDALDEIEEHIERGKALNKEAHELIGLIAAEFISDPMSVQCFDLRVVERVKSLVADRRSWETRLQELNR